MKQKELPTEGEFAFNLENVELGQDEDGDPVTSCVVTECDAEPAPVGPKLTGKALVGLRKLADCIIDQGVILPPSRQVPSHVTGVTLEQWRDYLQQAGIINRDGNPRQQFGRIKDKLVETGRIAIWGNLVWLVREVSHSTDARRGPSFHNTDHASRGQSEPCDGATPCKEEVFSENVTSVTPRHIDPCDASRHVTSPYKGCDGVTRDMTADVTAGNAEGQRAAEEAEQHPNGTA